MTYRAKIDFWQYPVFGLATVGLIFALIGGFSVGHFENFIFPLLGVAIFAVLLVPIYFMTVYQLTESELVVKFGLFKQIHISYATIADFTVESGLGNAFVNYHSASFAPLVGKNVHYCAVSYDVVRVCWNGNFEVIISPQNRQSFVVCLEEYLSKAKEI
jgi:hypothetical protein